MVGLENMVLQARRDLKGALGREPTLAEIAELLKVPPITVQRAWKLLNLPQAAFLAHLEAGRERLTQEEFLVLSLRFDRQQAGVHSAEQVAAAAGLTEADVLRLESEALAKLREVHSPALP